MTRRSLLMAAVVLGLAMPAPAVARQLVASPDPQPNATCETGCAIEDAMTGAESGDTVRLLAGTYEVDRGLGLRFNVHGVTVYGPAGGGATLNFGDEGSIGLVPATPEAPNRLAHVRIVTRITDAFTGGTYSVGLGANTVLDHVSIDSNAVSAIVSTFGGNIEISDTQIFGLSHHAVGIVAQDTRGAPVRVRNVTAWLRAQESIGLLAAGASQCRPTEVEVVNSILHGAGADISAQPNCSDPSVEARVEPIHSNFRADAVRLGTRGVVTASETNQTDAVRTDPAALFVDHAGRNFHPRPGAPTIDCGAAVPAGATDLDAVERPQGPAPDIGAYEAAGEGCPAPEQPGPGPGPGPGDGSPGPTPSPAPPAPPPPTVVQPVDTTGPVVTIPSKSRSLRATRGGVVPFAFGPVAENTTGVVSLKTDGKVRAGGKRKILALGSKAFQALEGQQVVVRIKLPKAGRKLLAKRGRVKLQATITLRDAAGNATVKPYKLVVKAPKRR